VLVPTLALTIGLVVWQMQSVSRRAISRAAPPPFHCCFTAGQLVWRCFAGIFFGWDNGSVDITNLAKVGSLRGDFADFRNALQRHEERGCREIAKELNVDAIVEGSVVKSGQKIRITAQLLDGPSDRHLWAESYERDFGDVLKLQNDVAEANRGASTRGVESRA